MAQTLPNGVVVPNEDGGETISATGVQEMRTLGGSVDTALADKATLAQLALKADQTQVDSLAGRVFFRGAIPSGSDLDTWLTDEYSGLWRTTAGVSPTLNGVPEQHQGQPFQILHMGSAARVTTQILIPYAYYSTTMLSRSVDNISTSTWTEWEPVGGDDIVSAMVPNSIRKAEFVQAMGGPIDTGGKAVVALRFDHGLANFRDKVLPAVKARGIKVAQAYNPRRWHLAENAGVTPSILNGWVAAGDVEIWNHSATHIAAETLDALRDEIVNGLAEIEAELPAAAGKVWGFAPPGFTGGDYMGFNDGRTPAGWDTHAGRLILQHHAVASGYLSGTQIRPLDGTPRDGQSHFTIDGMTVAAVKGHIDAAITQRGGLQLMLHPSQLDTADKMTTAQFTEVLDYIVAKRSAGELVTLSPYQMMVADATNVAPSWSDVTGKPTTYTPTAHTHPVADVTGLADRLAALEYESGPRNITSRMSVQPVSGALYLERIGNIVWCDISGIRMPSSAGFVQLIDLFPPGFRPRRIQDFATARRNASDPAGGLRVDLSGTAYFYVVDSTRDIRGVVSWPTRDAPPSNLPGTPA